VSPDTITTIALAVLSAIGTSGGVAAGVRRVSATATTLMVAGGPAVQGMSAATATLIGAGLAVAGTLLGVFVGLVVEYWLRRRGELRLDASPQWRKYGEGSRQFAMRLFDDRDVNISLWDAQVEFYRGTESIGTLFVHAEGTSDELGPIDLESRKSVYLTAQVNAGWPQEVSSEQARSANRVEFVATRIPGGKKVRKSLPLWDDAY
jgi:hypothetical protein